VRCVVFGLLIGIVPAQAEPGRAPLGQVAALVPRDGSSDRAPDSVEPSASLEAVYRRHDEAVQRIMRSVCEDCTGP
jgi:hypothetical protein